MDLDINSRAGLPEELRTLADLYPRDIWQGHANFSELTAFWLDRHGMFREVLTKLIADAEAEVDSPSDRYGAGMARYTGFFLEQLHGHHGIEDNYYFPKLIGLDGRLARGFKMLDADHHALEHHLETLEERSNAVLMLLRDGKGAHDQTGRLLETQLHFQDFLNRHLLDEEDLIVPLILEHAPEMG